jgi:hypothetical protein
LPGVVGATTLSQVDPRQAPLKLVCLRWLFGALMAALSPMWLGPMLLPIERAVAEAHHVCACGMAVGTCGCPECEKLEQAQREERPSPAPVLKGECDKQTGLLAAAHLPPAVLASTPAISPPVAVAELVPPPRRALVSMPQPAPPTPPPRRS